MSEFEFKYNGWKVGPGDTMVHGIYDYAKFGVVSISFGKIYIREPKSLGGNSRSYSFQYLNGMIEAGQISFIQTTNGPFSPKDPNTMFRRKRHHDKSN
jgi:hypothetical protein